MAQAGKTFRVRIEAKDASALAAVPLREIDTGCAGGTDVLDDGTYVIHAIVPESLLKRMKHPSLKIEVLGDRAEEGKQRQKEVGKGNRFTGENAVPRGVGRKIRDEGVDRG